MNYPQMPESKMPIVLLIIAAGVGVWLYLRGKKDGKAYIPDAPYLKGTVAIPAGYNPNILADELFAAMNDILVLSTTKEIAWNKLLTLPNDDMIIAVYNAFNKKYGPKGKGSLTAWINDEVVYNWGSSVKAKTVAKLRSLNLK